MDLGLKGQVALVAGASQGMGRAVALGFAREGAKVSICARGEAQLKEANAAKQALQSQLKQASQLWEADAAKLEEMLDQYGEL